MNVLDMNQLRNITLEDEDLMREIVRALVDDASIQIGLLAEAFQREDAGECARLAHSARGACGNVGAVSLATLFSSLERQAKTGDLSRCAPDIQRLPRELELLRTQLESI